MDHDFLHEHVHLEVSLNFQTPGTLFKRFTQAGSRAGLDKVLDILEDKKNPVKYVGLPLLVPWYILVLNDV